MQLRRIVRYHVFAPQHQRLLRTESGAQQLTTKIMSTQLPHPTTAPIPRYHSMTAYSNPLDQEVATIRASVYYRQGFDRVVIGSHLAHTRTA
jgi:hypothetical protein